MKHELLLGFLVFLIVSCTSVTYHQPGGKTTHVSTTFGDADIDRIEADGTIVGYHAKNTQATSKGLTSWVISKFVPMGETAVNETFKTAQMAIKP